MALTQFGDFILDDKNHRLSNVNSKSEVAIEPKLLELLMLFIRQPKSTITRQDILDQLWADSLVTDNAINKSIANLRKILGDEAKNSRYIQTVPKRGYRLVCQLVSLDEATELKNEKAQPDECHVSSGYRSYEVVKTVNLSVMVATISCFILLMYIVWQYILDDEEIKTGYSIALTRTQGTEFSPKLHPDKEHLYYLNESGKDNKVEFWFKNINTSATKRVELDNQINEIVAVTMHREKTKLIFLEKADGRCIVYQAFMSPPNFEKHVVSNIEKLFDCSEKRIKDIDYHQQQNAIYYAAQPKNFWPNHIYTFDIASKKHRLVTQTEPTGWGHHSIDISPDGEKLLIMSTDNDHKTQLLALNLENNKITEGIKFERPVYEAIWHHDSEHVFYYSEPPAHQIIKSELDGERAEAIISVSEELSSKMSRVPDSRNLLFTTESKNFDNRWLLSSSNAPTANNSMVSDSNPALFHLSKQYLFSSKRSGRMQLYLGNRDNEETKIVTNFSQSHSFGYLSMAPDDKSILLTLDEKVYQLPLSELSSSKPMTFLKPEYLIYTSEVPIISLDWQGAHGAAITVVKNGTPELIIVDLTVKKVKYLQGKWAYGLTDVKQLNNFYVIEQQSNRLYQVSLTDLAYLTKMPTKGQSAIQSNSLIDKQISLPKEFYLVRIDNGLLYYVTSESDGEYLHVLSLENQSSSNRYLLNNLARYDVSKGKIMVSDLLSKEGDIYRTKY